MADNNKYKQGSLDRQDIQGSLDPITSDDKDDLTRVIRQRNVFTAVAIVLGLTVLILIVPHIFNHNNSSGIEAGGNNTSALVSDTSASETDSELESEDNTSTSNTAPSIDTIVQIPDPALKKALQTTLGIGADEITLSDALSLTEFSYDGEENDKITDLTGLSEFTNLRVLILANNQLKDISPLQDLTKLEILFLDQNQIVDISPLASLTELNDLTLISNQISDISSIKNLTSLQSLALSINQINDISPLASLTELEYLWLGRNQISDISPLARLTKLRIVFLSENQIRDISPLATLTNLESLYLSYNPVLENKTREDILNELPNAENLSFTDF